MVEIGLIDHSDCESIMKEMQQKRIEDKIGDKLLICEHPEIVTVGPRAKNDGIVPPAGYDISFVDRGGGLTWHGPGQIVIYPIIKWDLENESNVKSVIEKLESWVIATFDSIGLKGYRDDRMQGVWVDEHKVCSIGLSFLRWTSRHGLTINYDTPSGRVEMVSGCGLGVDTTTSLSALGYKVTRDQILNSLIENVDQLSRKLIQ